MESSTPTHLLRGGSPPSHTSEGWRSTPTKGSIGWLHPYPPPHKGSRVRGVASLTTNIGMEIHLHREGVESSTLWRWWRAPLPHSSAQVDLSTSGPLWGGQGWSHPHRLLCVGGCCEATPTEIDRGGATTTTPQWGASASPPSPL